MQSINSKDLQLVLLPAKNPLPEFYPLYNKAYDLWQEVWGGFWRELGRVNASDGFIRQDEVCAIFHGDECIALTIQYVANLELQANRDDSYFSRVWLKQNLPILDPFLPYIYCGNNITTNPKYRQKAFGFSLKDVLAGVCVEAFLDHKECKVMASSMRRDRGVTDLALRFGAEKVYSYYAEDYKFDLDLVLFDRNKVHPCTDPIAREIIRELWKNKIDARVTPAKLKKVA